jgi:transposase
VNYVGTDLPKKTIALCATDQDRRVVARRTFAWSQAEATRAFFAGLRPFRAVVEATASDHRLVELIEPLAERVVLAHPGELRVLAESAKETDELDAAVLAEFLARDMAPEAFRPTRRQRQRRAMVRHRQHLKQSVTALKDEIRRVAADYSAGREGLFTAAGWEGLQAVAPRDADRFVLGQLHDGWRHLEGQLKALGERLAAFAAGAPAKEAEARAKLRTPPGVGPVTVDVVLSELGDVRRFESVKAVCGYAGLAPAVRQSGGKRSKDPAITKAGPPLLRRALVEAARRVIRQGAARRRVDDGIKRKAGARRRWRGGSWW